jgi:hypothetical protein
VSTDLDQLHGPNLPDVRALAGWIVVARFGWRPVPARVPAEPMRQCNLQNLGTHRRPGLRPTMAPAADRCLSVCPLMSIPDPS